jgi:hypothetical protein
VPLWTSSGPNRQRRISHETRETEAKVSLTSIILLLSLTNSIYPSLFFPLELKASTVVLGTWQVQLWGAELWKYFV